MPRGTSTIGGDNGGDTKDCGTIWGPDRAGAAGRGGCTKIGRGTKVVGGSKSGSRDASPVS